MAQESKFQKGSEWAALQLSGHSRALYFSETPIAHFAALHAEGEDVLSYGVRDWRNPDYPALDRHTMCHEASVGKIRFSALAYLMQQEEYLNLTDNAYAFFQQDFIKQFIAQKYPDQKCDVHAELMKLFSSDDHKNKVRLSDMLSHRAGMGDLRAFQISRTENRGIEHSFTLPQSLGLPWEMTNKIPQARGQFNKEMQNRLNREMKGGYESAERKCGTYQYSNVGFMLLSVALEAVYWKKTGIKKSYETLLKDFIINPVEGRASEAKEKIIFTETKFPSEFTREDNAANMMWVCPTKKIIANATRFNGHLAAVGAFSSCDDMEKFLKAFFRGFPGTPEHGQSANLFFTDETIACMQAQWERSEPLQGSDIEKPNPLAEHKFYAGPGFAVEENQNGEIVSYYKSGGGIGLARYVEFIPATGQINQTIRLYENVIGLIAQEAGVTMEELCQAYERKIGSQDTKEFGQLHFDRAQLLSDYQQPDRGNGYIYEKVTQHKKPTASFSFCPPNIFSPAPGVGDSSLGAFQATITRNASASAAISS